MATPSTKRGTRLEGKKAIITGAAGYGFLSFLGLHLFLQVDGEEVAVLPQSFSAITPAK